MASLLVSDTSVLVDLDRGRLLEALFGLPFSIGVPDVLYADELEKWNGDRLLSLGLRVLELGPDGVTLAQSYVKASTSISVPDAFALALCKAGGHTLLTGDRRLRSLAETEHVTCHGLLWVLDEIEDAGTAGPEVLLAGLEQIVASRRVRLPMEQVRHRLERYRRLAEPDRHGG
jgi:hypothetical protein